MELSCALVRRSHLPGEVVAWTGSFMSRRERLGIKLRWSYAPAEVKVLTSADSGNFEEASGWRWTARTEPSFEETIMFATPVSVKAVKVLMRGAKPWGYFGLSTVAAVAAPYSFMLVSGAAAIHEQCVVSTPAGLSAKPCVDAIVAGDGHEVFALTSAGSLQDVAGRCVALEAGKVEFRQCSNVGGVWEMTAEGQVKQGNMCLALGGPGVVAMDCEEAAAVGAGSFFPVAVPKYDPQAAAGVHSLGKLVRASVARQSKLLATLNSLTPKLAACKTKVSLMGSGAPATSAMTFASNHAVGRARTPGVADKIGAQFGVTHSQLSLLIGESAKALDAVHNAAS